MNNNTPVKNGEIVLLSVIGLFIILYWIQAIDISPFILIYPIALSTILLVLLVSQIYKVIKTNKHNLKDNTKKNKKSNKSKKYKRTIIILILVFSVSLWNILGTFINVIILSFLMIFVLGERKLVILIFLPIILAGFVIVIFQTLLGIPLPKL